MTPTTFHYHISVLFQNHIVIVQEKQYGLLGHFGRCTTRFRYLQRLHQVNQRLHDGVVRSIHVRV